MIAVLDLNISNIGSVVQALSRVGLDPRVERTLEGIAGASIIVLPGVGAFRHGMDSLREKGLVEPLRRHALNEGKPLLGFCLGMQLLANCSEEGGDVPGLGIVDAEVVRLRPNDPDIRVPNIGWCDAEAAKTCKMYPEGSPAGSYYFVHSYHMNCRQPSDIAATITYGGQRIAASIERGNVFGTQFHPEKSQDDGLDLLARVFRHLGGSEQDRATPAGLTERVAAVSGPA